MGASATARASLLIAGLVACGGDRGPFPGPQETGGPGAYGCERDEQHALFVIGSSPGSSLFSGGYDDRPFPQRLGRVRTAGDCTLYANDPTLCDSGCAGVGICDAAGVCQPYPSPIDIGVVRVTGTDPELEVDAGTGGGYSASGPALYETGAAITLEADGGQSGEAPFSLTVTGVPELTTPVAWPESWQYTEGDDLVITWDPVDVPPGTRIALSLLGDHHGDPSEIACVVDESGRSQIAVPAALMADMIGVSGYIEGGGLSRVNAAHVGTARGCAAFAAVSSVFIAVEQHPPDNGGSDRDVY